MILAEENVGAHFFWIAVPIIMTFGAGQYLTWRSSKKQREEAAIKGASERAQAADKVAEAINRRDDKLMKVLNKHTPHSHSDAKGAILNENNIEYPTITFNGE